MQRQFIETITVPLKPKQGLAQPFIFVPGIVGFVFSEWIHRTAAMQRLCVHDTNDVVSGLTALREVLSTELCHVEKFTEKFDAFTRFDVRDGSTISAEEFTQIRTALLSALVSIDELCGWVRVLAEKDSEGNDLDCVALLPEVNIPIKN